MTLTIPKDDHGQIRVFSCDQEVEKTDHAITDLFGATLNLDYVDVVRVSDLGAMTLTQYIQEGYDMAPDLVDAAALDTLKGTAILILSRATGGVETKVTLAHGVRHITTYSPTPIMTLPEDLPEMSEDAAKTDTPAKPRKSDARMSGMVATYALLAMFALVALMIWVGG